MATHKPTKIVGYLRTSTDDQLLGIDAQRDRVDQLGRELRCDIAQTFTEHESGGRNDRPELDRALRLARRLRAYLVVAKLDRLSRDQQFIMRLIDGNVPIIFGDLPDIDASTPEGRMMLVMMSGFAEFERRRIASRTREALRILKARGVALGATNPKCRNLTPEARAKGSAEAARRRTAQAVDEQSDIAELAAGRRAEGKSLRAIAAELNDQGYPTREGAKWTATQVLRVLRRTPPR